MKQSLLLLFFACVTSHARAQNNLAWLYSSVGQEYGKANTVDADTAYINAALFQGIVNANPNGTTNLTASGAGIDMMLTKYNRKGQLLWARRMGSAGSTEVPHGVATDGSRNLYVTGFFGATAATGPLTADFNPAGGGTLTSKGSEDIFVAKYDASGNYVWAFGLGNSAAQTRERGWDIDADAAGNVYVAGGFRGTMDFNPLGAAATRTLPDTNTGLFIAKYNTQGILQWVIPINAQLADIFTEGYAAIDLDGAGKLNVAGNFRGASVNFNPNMPLSVVQLSSAGNADMFIAQYKTSDGTINWLKPIGGPGQESISPGAMRCDGNGNLYLTGRIGGAGSVDFDPSAAIANVTGSALFLASYSPAGNFRYATGMNSGGGDGGHRVAFDAANNVFISGWMNGTATFGSLSKTAVSTTADVFLAKYSNDLSTCYWAHNFGGAGSTDNSICAGLAVDQEGNPIITGQLYGTGADVDPSSAVKALSSVGQNDCFVVKYTNAGLLWVGDTSSSGPTSIGNFAIASQCAVYPNPASDIIHVRASPGAVHLDIFNVAGKAVFSAAPTSEISIANLPIGEYLLVISGMNGEILSNQCFIKRL